MILHIDSSISYEASISRRLTRSLVAHLQSQGTASELIYRDLIADPAPQQSPLLQFARIRRLHKMGHLPDTLDHALDDALAHTEDEAQQTDVQQAAAVLDEVLAASVIVIGAPMYNFGVPSQLKAWIDCLFVAGKTFAYTPDGPLGLIKNKRVLIVSTRGGVHSAPSTSASLDHQEPYLRSALAILGISDLEIIRAEGVALSRERRDEAIADAEARIRSLRL